MAPKKRPRTDASSSHHPSGLKSCFNECFHTNALRECFDRNFASKRVCKSSNVDIAIFWRSSSELNLYDRVLHLILAWNLHPIKKHAKLRNIDYWWLDSFHTNRNLDLALVMFNDITKAIERGMNTNITLPHDTYLYISLEDEDIQASEHVSSPKHAPPPASSS
ncbi:hypothetical protein Gorai_016580 [Gossypium raimondii]|uniref:Uncharacterized protein n=1 Tax=Gossypium raimondii TaxID=29730 RepID=A0A7J8P9F4_GOSRA|nr:hypothetical protein [Gossypium raimondii]